MRFSIITPNYNGASFLEKTINSVLTQKQQGIELEYIVVDGGSTDNSHAIIDTYKSSIDRLIIEKDSGPANAINKGLAVATGDIIAWLNADDFYFPGALQRVKNRFECRPDASFCFGKCIIVNEHDEEIRKGITLFKEWFFPFSCRFVFQCINYVSQPAVFFRRTALSGDVRLREDMVAAWDYEFFLRLWHQGDGALVGGDPLSAFRWHESSISGQNFSKQFQEELVEAKKDAGNCSVQALIHQSVCWGIIGIYSCMSLFRRLQV
jgi:glycosyltransferase involved in cell wall biosynthesis